MRTGVGDGQARSMGMKIAALLGDLVGRGNGTKFLTTTAETAGLKTLLNHGTTESAVRQIPEREIEK
jgi:hypothetical protein